MLIRVYRYAGERMKGMDRVVATEKLTKHYGMVVGVEGLDMEIARGEIFGFLGPNGAGKTTTIRLLMGLLKPTRGKSYVLGRDSWRERVPLARKVGYLPGEPWLYDRLTGDEHLRLVAGLNGIDASYGFDIAARFGLDLNRRAEEYSRGMRQQLAIALALMKKPEVLVMDEPTNGLDPLMQHILYEMLSELRSEGTTVMFSSHNLPEVERISTRVGVIRDGRLVATETIEGLRSKRIRNVEISFRDGVPDEIHRLPGVTDAYSTGNRVRLKMKGDLNVLLRALARHEVSDLSIAHASLEDVFMEHYGNSRETSA